MYSKRQPHLIICFSLSLSTQIGVTAALLTTIVGVISVNQTWGQEWDIVPISLQVSKLKHKKSPKANFDGWTSPLRHIFSTKQCYDTVLNQLFQCDREFDHWFVALDKINKVQPVYHHDFLIYRYLIPVSTWYILISI